MNMSYVRSPESAILLLKVTSFICLLLPQVIGYHEFHETAAVYPQIPSPRRSSIRNSPYDRRTAHQEQIACNRADTTPLPYINL